MIGEFKEIVADWGGFEEVDITVFRSVPPSPPSPELSPEPPSPELFPEPSSPALPPQRIDLTTDDDVFVDEGFNNGPIMDFPSVVLPEGFDPEPSCMNTGAPFVIKPWWTSYLANRCFTVAPATCYPACLSYTVMGVATDALLPAWVVSARIRMSLYVKSSWESTDV